MLSHLTSSVSGEHAAALSGLFGTATPGQAVHGFAVLNLILAATALAASAMAMVSVRRG
jgi:hypothetical protein